MPTVSSEPLIRVCIRVRKADYDYIRTVTETVDAGGINLIIRTAIHSYVTQLKAIERRNLDKLESPTK
jgi:hypothetical protein